MYKDLFLTNAFFLFFLYACGGGEIIDETGGSHAGELQIDTVNVDTVSVDTVRKSVQGIYALGNIDKPFTRDVINNPYIDGLAIRATWGAVEPIYGQYDWTFLDTAFEQARVNGKKVSLSITAGMRTPDWVYQEGAKKLIYVDPNPYHDTFCTWVTIPVPYDPIFLNRWKEFITTVGNRYGNDPVLRKIRLSGINASTVELTLPHRMGSPIPNCDKTSYDITKWINKGYTASLIKNTWLDIAKTFQTAFPNKAIASAFVPDGLPEINDMGQYDKTLNLDQEIIYLGVTKLGAVFIPENHGLSAFWDSNFIKTFVPNSPTGYQMLWFVTGDATYRMNNGGIGDTQTIFLNAVKRGINAGGNYLEIYMDDILNPDLQSILKRGNIRMSGGLLIYNVQAADITSNSATITWNTFEAADSQVEYGLTSTYGALTYVDAAKANEHNISIYGLLPSTKYHFSAKSVDRSGNEGQSFDFTFKTN